MLNNGRSAELLQTIAETVGADLATFDAWRSGRTARDSGDTPAEHHRTVLLFRLIRAFRSLPDGETRLQALQYVEGLAAEPSRAE
ncbi:hypothetical protein [uncultured Methylobacterium sp.]|uniref:hypothetical protein n=1 Tax=uncultured Methylobacterium sp. TaxID=157278 RepID=UPI0035CB63C8